MNSMVNYVLQHWGLLATLFCSGGVSAYIVKEILALRRSTWRERMVNSIPEAIAGQTVTPATMKTSTVLKILILLIITLPAAGYVGRDLQIRHDRELWKSQMVKWERTHQIWESKYLPQENR